MYSAPAVLRARATLRTVLLVRSMSTVSSARLRAVLLNAFTVVSGAAGTPVLREGERFPPNGLAWLGFIPGLRSSLHYLPHS